MQLAKHEVEASYYAVLYQVVANSFPVPCKVNLSLKSHATQNFNFLLKV